MEEKMDYENEINIDESALDLECLEQPRLMLKYGSLYAKMNKLLELAKDHKETVRARLSRDIRANPTNFGLEKITDAAVEATIQSHRDYQQASEEYIEARYNAQLINAVVESFEHRKSMLELLVKLNGQNYFSAPQTPRNLHEERIKRRTSIQNDIEQRIAKRIRSNNND